MKKILVLVTAFVLTLSLAGCTKEVIVEVEKELPALPADGEIDMSNLDMYLDRPDVQYVDLRNFDDKMASGYIAGFEFIPFFDYLEFSEILVRTDDWNHVSANIMNQGALFTLFDQDKAIFLMCGSGTRAGFVKSALEELGYENVYNVGGIANYTGDNKVLGDGEFVLDHPMSGPFTPGTHFAVDPQTQYTATIVVNETGYITDVVFDAMYHGTTKNTLDTAYTLGSGVTWKARAEELAAYVQANQGWGDIVLTVADLTDVTMLNAPRHPIYIDRTNSPDGVAGVSIGAEGFVLAWNLAIEMAGGTPVPGVFTSEEWQAANGPAFEYVDGVYFGDSEDGVTAKVTIEDGKIVDVYFDQLRIKYTTEIVVNDNGTPADPSDDFDEVVVTYTTFTTKQVLGEAYTLASGFTWAEEADELAAAIVDAQQWDPLWVILNGEDFDVVAVEDDPVTPEDETYVPDAYTVDAVGGVTITIDGFHAAFAEAIAQAVPAAE